MMLYSGTNRLYNAPVTRGRGSTGCSVGARPFSGAAAARRSRTCTVRAAEASNPNDFGESVKRIAKKIQGGLPVIGLLSRLASPQGGFDELAYPEFCRSVYDRASPAYFEAVQALEKAHGKPAVHRQLLLVLWMAQLGSGAIPAKDVISGARRVRVSHDVEFEVDRFEGAREAALKKYTMMERPQGRLAEQVEVAVDALAALTLGLPEGKPIPEVDAARIATLVAFVFPEAGDERVRQAVQERPQRSYS
ncbi:hypothetical protein MNEG_7037 [Monoraphidium neglectum]|uniref:Uncharacterized protein n=1 Tax=Monoraphidium neglectum TaxID=145388 RepID=A0A0D2MJX1_9CHLO|nr:hypothetical protein MNEG_7037 [Monoraphidium neglectum]KIZ00922.1 hypothetical protein MNEG_7037 [Monoraphidium neglectum]|eukprot:XP_013899941.1 hypothetical protein MNEG_7037 [Monoraphidium neglectum]